MKKYLLMLAVGLAAGSALAALIWEEDFSSVSDWSVIYDPSGGSTITSDGSMADMYVDGGGTDAAFAPDSHIAFDPALQGDYTLLYTVDSISGSTSYDVALDCFNSSMTFIDTIWNVTPGYSTFVGAGTTNLGGLDFTINGRENTAYVAPKVNVHTGTGAQTVTFDNMSMDQAIPEPATVALIGLGLGGLFLVRRRTR